MIMILLLYSYMETEKSNPVKKIKQTIGAVSRSIDEVKGDTSLTSQQRTTKVLTLISIRDKLRDIKTELNSL